MYDYDLERPNTRDRYPEPDLQWLEDAITIAAKALFCSIGLLLYGVFAICVGLFDLVCGGRVR